MREPNRPTHLRALLAANRPAGWLGGLSFPALGCAGLLQGQFAKQPTVGCKVAVASWQAAHKCHLPFLGGLVQYAMYVVRFCVVYISDAGH